MESMICVGSIVWDHRWLVTLFLFFYLLNTARKRNAPTTNSGHR
jgi:hypothetical protein